MGLEQQPGRIVVNTGVGQCEKVDQAEVNEYSFIGDDRVHHYNIDGKEVSVNQYKKIVKRIRDTQF